MSRKKVKLKSSVVVLLTSCTIAVLICVFFMTTFLPFLNLINNSLKDSNEGKTHFFKNIISSDNFSDDDGKENTDYVDTPSDGNNTFTRVTNMKGLVKPGTINIMIIGVDDPNEGRFDTMVLCSIDRDAHTIKLISIPRDTYVPYSDSVMSVFRKNFPAFAAAKGSMKLNATYNVGNVIKYNDKAPFTSAGMNFFHDTIQDLYNIDFVDYVYFDFEGFIGLIDIMGGIDITAERDIRNDRGEMILGKGTSHVDGERALMYARHRYLYDQYGNPIPTEGDTYRKQNQLTLLMDMARQLVTMKNIPKTGELLTQLRKNVFHSIDASDIVKYSDIAIEFTQGKYTLHSYLITGVDADPLGDNASYVIVK